MDNRVDTANLMYVTKEYENNLKETARKIYANDEVKLTIENIDKQLNDILIEMNDKLNFISGKIHDPETGVDAYLEGVHTQIDNIDVDARDMIDDGVETTRTHPSVMSVKSDRNATKFNTFDFINKSIRLDANSPLLRFDSKYELNDEDTVHTFRINHDKKEYIKIIEFSFTYKQKPSVMNKKNGDSLEEESTVVVTRVINGRFFVIWEDPFNEPGKFIIKAIVENADNTGNIIDKKIIDVKELSKLKEVNYSNWKNTNISNDRYYCITLAQDGTLVTGSNSNTGIKYSDDNGITWNDTNITSGNYLCITIANNGRLVAGNNKGIKYSDDNGITWNDTNITTGSYSYITLANNGRLVACSTSGIIYSDDNGKTWNNSNGGSYNFITLANDGTLVAGNGSYGVKYSIDNGITWNETNMNWGYYFNCIIVANNDRLIAGSNEGVKYSDDNGKTWNDTDNYEEYKCIILANDGRLVAGSNRISNKGIKYSDDNGITWNSSNLTSGDYYCIAVAQDGTLVAGGGYYDNGVKYSDDNGITWNDSNITSGICNCITLAKNGILITASNNGGIKYNNTTKTEIEDLSVILDDGPQFDLYFTADGNSIDISIGKIVPYRWLMRKNYITFESNKPIDNIHVDETLETPEFDQSNVFYSKVINTYFIIDKVNHKISYVVGGNKFSNSIPLSPSTNIPYSGEEITDFRLMDTSTFTFLTLNNETYASLNNFESFVKLDYKIIKVFELSTKEILLLRDNGNIHLFDIKTGTVNDIVFISPRSQDVNFNADYSISEVDNKYIVIFTSTPNGFSYKIKNIDKSTNTYGSNQITSLDTEIDSSALTSLGNITFESATIKSVSNIYGLFVLVNHIHENQIITNIVYLSDIIESGLSYIYKTTKVLKEYDYINQTENDLSLPIKDIKTTSMFMFGIGNNGELFIIDSSYISRAIKTILSGNLFSDEKSMLYLEKEDDAEDLFLVENPYCNEVIDVIETPNGIFIIDKHGIYELLDSKELHCLIYIEDNFVSSIPDADLNNSYGVFVSKNKNKYNFYKTNYNTKNIPRTHIKYKYIDLFNDLYQKFDENKSVNEYSDELPIIKFNSILYVNFIDHLSSIYNTEKINSIRYIDNKTYGSVKVGPAVDRNFTQILNNGTTVSKVGTFINTKFVLSTNKYGFKKYKDIIKVDDNARISDINELKRYVIRNKKDSGKDISLVSKNIIKFLSDEYNFIIGNDTKSEKVIYKSRNKSNTNISLNDIEYGERKKYSKIYYTANGTIYNYGYFNRLIETPIGAFIQKEYTENSTIKGAVYYVSPEILCKFAEDHTMIPKYLGDVEDSSITPLVDIVASNGLDATKFVSDREGLSYNQEINYFDVKFIDNGHDTVILIGNGIVVEYDCITDVDIRSWSQPFSESINVTSLTYNEHSFTNMYVDGNIVYLWNSNKTENFSSLCKYNTITKQFDSTLVNITNDMRILNMNKIGNTLHVFAYDSSGNNRSLMYFTIDLISNTKTIIETSIKLINDNEDISIRNKYGINNNPNYVIKTYETDKAYIFFIVLLGITIVNGKNNQSITTIFKYMKNEDSNIYKQVKLNNNVTYPQGLYGLTVCKDIENNYKLVGISSDPNNGMIPLSFIYNEESDVITPLEISGESNDIVNICGKALLDQEYNKDDGTIDCIMANDTTGIISIKIPDMINSYIINKGNSGCHIVFDNNLVSFENSSNKTVTIKEFKDNKIGVIKKQFDLRTILDSNESITYRKTKDITPVQNKSYFVIDTTQIHFTPINHTMVNNLIGCEVVFKRIENATNYVLVDTINKQRYPLKGVKYYKKDLNGNYIEANVSEFESSTKYYEKENTFVPVDISTLLDNENLNIQYYRADNYRFITAPISGSFDANIIYFERIENSGYSNNLSNFYFEEKNNELYLNCFCNKLSSNENIGYKAIFKLKFSSLLDNISIVDYHFNTYNVKFDKKIIDKTMVKINDDEYVACIRDYVTNKTSVVRCNYFGNEWYNEYLDFSNDTFTNDNVRMCMSENKHIFISDMARNKTYMLTDDYSHAIVKNDTIALDIFDTESGIFGITTNTSDILIYKFNEETGLFDNIIFDKNDGTFLRAENICITMKDGFKAIFIFGILNNRPTCYKLYKGTVSLYEIFDPEIHSLQFTKYTIYERNNKICFTPNFVNGKYYVMDVNEEKTISKISSGIFSLSENLRSEIYYFDDNKLYLMISNTGDSYMYFDTDNKLFENQNNYKSFSPIDTYNTSLPIIDKDGHLWYKNAIANINTGMPDPTRFYRAYDTDKETLKYEHIVFKDMVATEDGIFGIKDGCIYLNKSFSDSNNFYLVFSNIINNDGTNYNIGSKPENDVLLYSKKFGLFYHTPNGMIFRWNGSEFVSVFGDIIDTSNNATFVVNDYNKLNKESSKVNDLFYSNENILLICDRSKKLYYFDINSNKFENFDTLSRSDIYNIVETSIGTLILSYTTVNGNKVRNSIELITYSSNAIKITKINHSGKYLHSTEEYNFNNEINNFNKVFEDPISKAIVITSPNSSTTGELFVIDKDENGYKLFTAVLSEEDISLLGDSVLSNENYQIIRTHNTKIVTTKAIFNISFNNDKTKIIFSNVDKFGNLTIKCLFDTDDGIYGIANNSSLIKLEGTSNITLKTEQNIRVYPSNLGDWHDCVALNWNGILFLSFKTENEISTYNNILISLGKLFERITKQDTTGYVGFDLTFIIKNSNIFNNIDELTENSLVDKLVIKTTGLFTNRSITNIRSYIMNEQRYKNLKEIESKYSSVFNLFKNIYKKYDNKNLMSYRFNQILSNSSDAIMLGYIDKINKSDFDNLISSILKTNELNDDYKIEINVYPAAVTKVETVKEVIGINGEYEADMPKLDKVPYKPFNPFEDYE